MDDDSSNKLYIGVDIDFVIDNPFSDADSDTLTYVIEKSED